VLPLDSVTCETGRKNRRKLPKSRPGWANRFVYDRGSELSRSWRGKRVSFIVNRLNISSVQVIRATKRLGNSVSGSMTTSITGKVSAAPPLRMILSQEKNFFKFLQLKFFRLCNNSQRLISFSNFLFFSFFPPFFGFQTNGLPFLTNKKKKKKKKRKRKRKKSERKRRGCEWKEWKEGNKGKMKQEEVRNKIKNFALGNIRLQTPRSRPTQTALDPRREQASKAWAPLWMRC